MNHLTRKYDIAMIRLFNDFKFLIWKQHLLSIIWGTKWIEQIMAFHANNTFVKNNEENILMVCIFDNGMNIIMQ